MNDYAIALPVGMLTSFLIGSYFGATMVESRIMTDCMQRGQVTLPKRDVHKHGALIECANIKLTYEEQP